MMSDSQKPTGESRTMQKAFRSFLKNTAVIKARRILCILICVYLLCTLALFAFQRSFLYFPSQNYVTLRDARANDAYKEFPVRTKDGIDLKAWYAPATSKPFTFVFFHGNGDSLSTASDIGDPYINAGYGFLVAEYRGYSGLPGKPSEAGLYADARAYIDGLIAQGVKSENIILYGHSLGTGVAAQMAEEFQVGGVVLLAPYLSIAEMAQREFPYFPAKFIVLDRFDNEKKMNRIHAPLLIVNGARDRLIPPVEGEQLYELANEPRQFISLPDRGHNDAFGASSVLTLDWASHLR